MTAADSSDDGQNGQRMNAKSAVFRSILFWITWCVAFVATPTSWHGFGISSITCIIFFPSGLERWLKLPPPPPNFLSVVIIRLMIGWLVYAILSIIIQILAFRKGKLFYLFYSVLVVLLLLNIAGCRANEQGMHTHF